MSDFLVRIAQIILRIGEGQSDRPATRIVGDYQRREARRSALWAFFILVSLFLFGWLTWRWITQF